MELEFPIEFTVLGRPISSQSQNAKSKALWRERIKAASTAAIPQPHFVSDHRIAVTLYYLPERRVHGDVDNIVKLVLDAMSKHIYLDDAQVERVVVQKFEPGNVFGFLSPTLTMAGAIAGPKPVLYVRVSNDPFEDLR
jgi:Holliday junction resolvase RusA-like endonuclease